MYSLRNYQQDIVTRVHEAWKHHRSVMVQMPTGTGKTHVLASIVAGFSGKVLIVAHRVELVEQIRSTVNFFRSQTGSQKTQHAASLQKSELISQTSNIRHHTSSITHHQSEIINHKSNITVSSIQSISRRIDGLEFVPSLVVIDEAHHALAKTYRILWEKWSEAKFLGLTATPCRMNGKGFTDLFDTLVVSENMAEFIRKGVLSAFDYVSIRSNSRDQQLIDSLQKRGADGDYQVKEMESVLNRKPSIGRLYESMVRFAEGKKGIVYAISIDHARRIAEHYRQKGVAAAAIDSRTPGEERKRLVECFKRGELQVLVNVDVFSEGFDCPDVEFVQMARPTLSLAKYLQQVGRGLRKSEGKECCMLIDNVGLYRVFGLPVQAWNWEKRFLGEMTGKGRKEPVTESQASNVAYLRMNPDEEPELDMELVVSHEALLEKLDEWDAQEAAEEKLPELKAWQDAETGLWGLRRGRKKTTEADYVTVFGIKDGQAAVRFRDKSCGLVDAAGGVIWKKRKCLSLKFARNGFLVALEQQGGKERYVDLKNLQEYAWKPEVKRYGAFELLKVRHTCYSRTQEVYASDIDFGRILIADKGFYLFIFEHGGRYFCLLKGDEERYYSMCRKLEDGSIVVADRDGRMYHVTVDGKKERLEGEDGRTLIDRLEAETRTRLEAEEEGRKLQIRTAYKEAIPYKAGVKWGLKVGNKVTIPPIYRKVQPPVGEYCAVEMNYGQWGVIGIDGTIWVEPKYPEVSVEENGTVVLTSVTGKKRNIQLR